MKLNDWMERRKVVKFPGHDEGKADDDFQGMANFW
jgi:hypothetical protein